MRVKRRTYYGASGGEKGRQHHYRTQKTGEYCSKVRRHSFSKEVLIKEYPFRNGTLYYKFIKPCFFSKVLKAAFCINIFTTPSSPPCQGGDEGVVDLVAALPRCVKLANACKHGL